MTDIDEVVLEQLGAPEADKAPGTASLNPPCFVVTSIAFDQELAYFIGETGLPVFYVSETECRRLGMMKPDLDTVFMAKFLDTGAYYVDSDGKPRDLNDPATLIGFITFPRG